MASHGGVILFVEFLKEELQRRTQKNPRYSVRAFARALAIHSSTLSALLNSKRTMTPKMVKKLAEKLELGSKLKDYFVSTSVDPWIEVEMFAEWEHGAILSILQLKEKESTPNWIAAYLNISNERAEQVIDRLLELNFIYRIGKELRITPSNSRDSTANTEK